MTKMLSFGQPLGGVMQIAHTVPDLEKAIHHWTSTLNIGPFFVFEHFALEDYRYRGKPSEIDISLAMAFSGSMCFELIYQHSTAPSVYTDVIEKRGHGFHHWAVSTEQFEKDLADHVAQGNEEALYGRVAPVDGRAAYVDTFDKLCGMIELIEINPAVEELFSAIKEPSLNWDGTDPIRSLG